MRIGTLRSDGGLRTVALRDEELVELEGSIIDLLADPARARRALDAGGATHPLSTADLAPAVPNPGKILCIGKNYADHAEELGGTPPEKPEVFLRTGTSLAGPHDALIRPHVSQRMDWEVELAVVIGRRARYVAPERAMEIVAGYCVFNDISFRDYQRNGSQWIPGKNFDGSGPLGPFVVTANEVSDPFDLELTCIIERDGREEVMQRSNSSLMVHRIPDLIAYITQWATLEPGDVIATGTPGGVGDGRNPKRYLVPGETVVTRVAGLGALKNQVLEEAANGS
jgi:acylpyruvate hydrolase